LDRYIRVNKTHHRGDIQQLFEKLAIQAEYDTNYMGLYLKLGIGTVAFVVVLVGEPLTQN
jgi:hypothetical protein